MVKTDKVKIFPRWLVATRLLNGGLNYSILFLGLFFLFSAFVWFVLDFIVTFILICIKGLFGTGMQRSQMTFGLTLVMRGGS